MRRMFEARSLAVLLALLAAAVPKVEAQAPDPDPARFDDDMAAFARSDAKNSVPDAATVFVGSSSIVRWNTAERFPHMRLLNRGFGGSHVSDVNHFIEETVLRYSPDVVVFYAGDNDTSAGKSSEQIFEDLRDFAEGVMHSNSTTQVVFISVKPSLSRWTVWSQMVATNTLLRAYADKHANVHYADVATPMLGADGEPIPDLFVRDGLHMTEAGYDIWTRVVGDLLARLH